MSALMTALDTVTAAAPSGADDTPEIPPVGPPARTTLGIVWVLRFVYAAGAAVAVVVFAARTAVFAGSWNENITAGPARKLVGSIVFLIATVAGIASLGWLRGELS